MLPRLIQAERCLTAILDHQSASRVDQSDMILRSRLCHLKALSLGELS